MKKAKEEDQALAALFGGTWMPLPAVGPDESPAAAAAVARGEGGTHYVVVESAREAMVGAVKGKVSDGSRLAGQLLASVCSADEISTLGAVDVVEPNLFRSSTLMYVGQHVGNDRVAVAVLNGVPVLDFVGNVDQVVRQAHGFMEKIVGGGILLVQGDVQQDFRQLMDAAPSAHRTVSSLPFNAQWKTATMPLRPVGLSRARLAMVGAALGLVVAPALYHGWRYYAQSELQKEAAARMAFERANASNVVQRLQGEALGMSTLAAAGPAGHMAFDFAKGLLDERGGFALEKLQLSPKESLALYARRNKRHSFDEFVTQGGDDGTPAFDVAKLDAGSVIYKPLAWDKVAAIDLANPEAGSSALLQMGTLAQRVEAVDIKLAISAASAVLTSEQLGRVDQATLAKVGRKAGSWTATGPADLFVGLMDALPPRACTLSQVEFRYARDQRGVPADTFQASGRWIVGWS